MDAAKLTKVPDSISRGVNALPSAGSNGTIPGGTVGAGPAPTAAKNSGTKLDNSLLGPSNSVNNGQGRQYAAKDDAKVAVNSSSTGTTASNE